MWATAAATSHGGLCSGAAKQANHCRSSLLTETPRRWHARRLARAASRKSSTRADTCDLPFGPNSFDFVLSSMLHYFSLDDAVRLLAGFARIAKRAVVIADVERHWFPYLAIGVLARLTGERLVRRHFGNTVLEGFTRSELVGLTEDAGFVRWRIQRYFPYRLVLVGERGEDR